MTRGRQAVSVIFFANGFVFSNYIARLPNIQSLYGLDYTQLGYLLLASSIGSLLAMPFTGALIARTGSKYVSTYAMVLVCIAVASFVLLPYYALVLLLFFMIGAGSGMTDVAMNAQAVLVERSYARSIMNSFHAIWSLGLFIGAGIGSLFIWFSPSIFIHLVTISSVSLLAIFWASLHLIAGDKNLDRRVAPFNLPHPSLLGIGVIAFCAMLGEGAMAEWSTNYMRDTMAVREAFAPAALFTYSFAMLVGRLLGDKLRMRWGDPKLLRISSVAAVAGTLLITLASWVSISLLGFLIAGLGLATVVPLAYSRAGNVKGIDPGLGISMVTTIGYSGFIIGPPIIGWLGDWQDLQFAFFFVVSLFLIMLLLTFTVK